MRPITMSDSDGALIYRRSLNFLLEMAFADLFPSVQLRIDHSISFGGYYCQVGGRGPLTSERTLRAAIAHEGDGARPTCPSPRSRCPFRRPSPIFERLATVTRSACSRYRRKPYLTLYSLGNRMDYHHGYMVPSTGYLKWFELTQSNGGFTLRFPRRHSPTSLEPMTPYPAVAGCLPAVRRLA